MCAYVIGAFCILCLFGPYGLLVFIAALLLMLVFSKMAV